ncbi:hypothetical protein BJ138DRAFT_1159921, partial [Hygrophoropsis aurantiaca]
MNEAASIHPFDSPRSDTILWRRAKHRSSERAQVRRVIKTYQSLSGRVCIIGTNHIRLAGAGGFGNPTCVYGLISGCILCDICTYISWQHATSHFRRGNPGGWHSESPCRLRNRELEIERSQGQGIGNRHDSDTCWVLFLCALAYQGDALQKGRIAIEKVWITANETVGSTKRCKGCKGHGRLRGPCHTSVPGGLKLRTPEAHVCISNRFDGGTGHPHGHKCATESIMV